MSHRGERYEGKQAGAELCQAQFKLGLAKTALIYGHLPCIIRIELVF